MAKLTITKMKRHERILSGRKQWHAIVVFRQMFGQNGNSNAAKCNTFVRAEIVTSTKIRRHETFLPRQIALDTYQNGTRDG